MTRKIITFFFFSIFIKAFCIDGEARLLRFPAISGDKIVFSCGGDLYTVSSDGGIARKLTSHKGYEMFPRFSPDGKFIAFTAQYDGNSEVYLMPGEGGVPRRLTYTALLTRDEVSDRMGPNNIVMCWKPDGKSITYRSRKLAFNDFKGMLFNVPVKGGLSEELPLSVAGFCSYSPDGKKLAFNKIFREFRTWKYYKGGMTDDIWIYDFETKKTENITNNERQDIIPMWIGREIYYLSDRDRIMNMFVYNLDTKETKKVTDFALYDIKFPSAGGNMIVFENGGYIYKFNTDNKKFEKVSVVIEDDALWARAEYKDASKYIRTAGMSPNGERIIFGARGDVYSAPVGKGITRNLTNTPGIHERNVNWSPDGQYIAYISDASGDNEIYIVKQDGSEEAIQLTYNADTYKFNIKWSPDSKKILWADRMMRLQYVDIKTKKVNLVTRSNYDIIEHYNWSPDSRWIVFDQLIENRISVISVCNTETGSIRNITSPWFDSGDPDFSLDSKYIVFVSSRDFNPTYSANEWNHAYINMMRIYLVTLKKDTPSPFTAENKEVILSGDNTDKDSTSKKKEKANDKVTGKNKPETVSKTEIDFEDIENRTISLPIRPSTYFDVCCVNNTVYYHEKPQGEAITVKMYDLKKQEETELGKSMQVGLSQNGKKMLVKDGDRWGTIDLPSSKISMKDIADLNNMKVWVDYKLEWKQIFDECWRQMRDFFYVSNMAGIDWKAIHEKYAPLVPYVRHRDDLTYIIGEMIGELSTGHTYVGGGERPRTDKIATGLLGAKLSKDISGYFRIDKILDGANWSKDLRSPLKEIGINVKEGDYIIAMDGRPLKDVDDIYQLLLYKADKEILLTVNSKPVVTGGKNVLVIPISDESNLYYYNWVQNNIKKVNEATNDQVGYLHIPDMSTEGLNEFAKYFYPQLNKKVLIIDDRGNGGGNVSPMIIERLRRELTRSKMFRNSIVPYPSPTEMMMGPKILLIDQYSASDGDLFAYAFKKHQLGKVIGRRTWGGVVGISGTLPFIDGTELRKPEFASYSADSSAWIIEGIGVEPDIAIDNDPSREYLGIDDQLNKAIEIAKEQLKLYKPLPPIPPAPDKSK
jgi:tricorn protease